VNLEYFISKNLSFGEGKSFAKTIMRLAIAGVAVGVAVMLISSAMITGFKNEISEKIFGFWGTIHITDIQINNNNDPVPMQRSALIAEEIEDIGELSYQKSKTILGKETEAYETVYTEGGVKQVQAFALVSGIIKTKKYLEAIMLKGVDVDFEWSKMDEFIIKGTKLGVNQETAVKEILISKITANRLELDIGQKLIVHFIKSGRTIKKAFKVVGIYSTGLEEYDRRIAMVDLKKIQEVNNWGPDEIGGYEVMIDDIDDLEVMSQHIYREILPGNLTTRTIKEKFPSIFQWLDLQKMNEYVILGLMVLVCIINMITALLILILERTKMIGILKSLGAGNWSIRKIFLYQGAIVVLYGLFFGNLIGLGLSAIQKATGFIKLDEKNYYLSEAPIEFNIWSILMINGGTFIMIMLALIIPTLLISRITPVKVLRFQ